MVNSKKLIISAITAVSLAASSASLAADKNVEKCYGVVKAGQNDCGTPEHACAGIAKTDSLPHEWVFLPKGSCDKIAGGSLTPIAADTEVEADVSGEAEGGDTSNGY